MLVIIASGELIHHRTNTLFSAGTNLTINAEVDSLFTPISHGFRGIAIVRSINGKKIGYFSRPKIVLISPVPLELNAIVNADIKLKPIIGVLNQIGFDKEQWAVSQQIVGQATIKPNQSMWVSSHFSWRESLYQQMLALTQNFRHQGLLLALSFGERGLIDNTQWQHLQRSGLNHLIAISGLHIGIAFGFGWLLGFQVVRCGVVSVSAPMVAALCFAVGYAWLSGFSLPTQRALILMVILLCFRFSRIHTSYRYKWLLMVAGLLLYDPFAAYSLSFWLSIYAVGAVFLCLSFLPKGRSRLKHALVNQISLVMLITPLIALLFHGVGFASVLYNAVFVPWFSLVLIPVTLASVALLPIWPNASHVLLKWVDQGLSPVSHSIAWGDDLWLPTSHEQALYLVALLILILLFKTVQAKFLCVAIAVLLFVFANRRDSSSWHLTMFDVGHGLTIMIEKQGRVTLYDTGASWDSSSYAEQLLLPYLSYRKLELDKLVISHFDNDHAGGVNPLLRTYPQLSLISSQIDVQPNAEQSRVVRPDCIAGNSWQWQGLNFAVLWPPQKVSRPYNPHSCVLKVTDAQHRSVLLTGDIDAVAEWLLLRTPEVLKSDVVVVPHHGSRSSSRRAFVHAVNADIALVSSAYQGRWKLPNPQVKERYIATGANWVETGFDGQITLTFTAENIEIDTMRGAKGQAWYRQMLRKRVE